MTYIVSSGALNSTHSLTITSTPFQDQRSRSPKVVDPLFWLFDKPQISLRQVLEKALKCPLGILFIVRRLAYSYLMDYLPYVSGSIWRHLRRPLPCTKYSCSEWLPTLFSALTLISKFFSNTSLRCIFCACLFVFSDTCAMVYYRITCYWRRGSMSVKLNLYNIQICFLRSP